MIKYFTFKELIDTSVQSPNIPNWEEIGNLQLLGSFLDSVRIEYGKPITVNSGFRSETVNKAVGGSASSYHRKGLAADIKCPDMKKLRTILEKHIGQIDQLGIYTDKNNNLLWFHVGLPTKNNKPRNQIYYEKR